MDRIPKPEQNTNLDAIDPIEFPATRSIIDRYVLASHWCKDKIVLDAACGHGFGSDILYSLGAKQVCGMDIDKKAIENSHGRYSAISTDFLVKFLEQDLTKDFNKKHFKEDLKSFYDTVVSIETFEHIPREKVNQMLKNFKYTCKPGGTILITTPLRRTEEFIYYGGTHLWEYSYEEFLGELKKVWDIGDIKINWLIEEWVDKKNFVTLFSEDIKDMKRASLFFAEITND